MIVQSNTFSVQRMLEMQKKTGFNVIVQSFVSVQSD